MRRRRTDPIEAILADRAYPDALVNDADEVDALAMAIELRAARPGSGHPDETFVANLRRQLTEHPAPTSRSALVSRRTALVGAAGAVAGAAAAAVVAVETRSSTDAPQTATLQPSDGRWTPVATIHDVVAATILPISNADVRAFVSLRADNSPVAVSGVCTHQGCLLRANSVAKRLECPCHNTAFAMDGTLLYHQLPQAPTHLPLLQLRQVGETIEAFLPHIL